MLARAEQIPFNIIRLKVSRCSCYFFEKRFSIAGKVKDVNLFFVHALFSSKSSA
jgi:hypothetical protein